MNLKFTGLVCLTRYVHCTYSKRSISRESRSKVKKLINVANFVLSQAFELLMLRDLNFSGMVDLNGNLCFRSFGRWRSTS